MVYHYCNSHRQLLSLLFFLLFFYDVFFPKVNSSRCEKDDDSIILLHRSLIYITKRSVRTSTNNFLHSWWVQLLEMRNVKILKYDKWMELIILLISWLLLHNDLEIQQPQLTLKSMNVWSEKNWLKYLLISLLHL